MPVSLLGIIVLYIKGVLSAPLDSLLDNFPR
jgi:hypothetical protein